MFKNLIRLGLIPVTVIALQACVGGEGVEEGVGGVGGGVEEGIGEREGGFGGGEGLEGED